MLATKQPFAAGFCAGDPRSVLMWSHYGGEHYGVCLQFEVSRDPMTLMRAVSVDYVDHFKRINWVGGDYHRAVGETFTSKHIQWSDEVEHRITSKTVRVGTFDMTRPL
jgi:Protein of unknown function (DUF2971)